MNPKRTHLDAGYVSDGGIVDHVISYNHPGRKIVVDVSAYDADGSLIMKRMKQY